MDFLPDALANHSRVSLSPFATCIVLSSLISRCMSYRRLSMAASLSDGLDPRKVWSKFTWLALAVERRKLVIVQSFSGSATDDAEDAMVVFVHALAACAAIYVYQSMAHSLASSTSDQEETSPAYEEQAVQAADELVHYVKTMPHSFSHFKAHPFLPTLIHRAAVFLLGLPKSSKPHRTGYQSRDDDLNILFGVLRHLQQINNSSRGILDKLEKDSLYRK
jgi:hypothetical protein